MEIFSFLIHGYFWLGVLAGWMANPLLDKLWIKAKPIIIDLWNKLISKIKK